MSTIVQGRIVYVRKEVPDPQGRNPKANRPFMVISPNGEISSEKPLEMVAITGESKGDDDEVTLPWGPIQGKQTKLGKPSVAKCTWTIPPPDVFSSEVESGGFVKPAKMLEILRTIQRFR